MSQEFQLGDLVRGPPRRPYDYDTPTEDANQDVSGQVWDDRKINFVGKINFRHPSGNYTVVSADEHMAFDMKPKWLTLVKPVVDPTVLAEAEAWAKAVLEAEGVS